MKKRLLALVLAGTLVLSQGSAVWAEGNIEPEAEEFAVEESFDEGVEDVFEELELDAEEDDELAFGDETANEEVEDQAEIAESWEDVEIAEEAEEEAEEIADAEAPDDALFFDDTEFVDEEPDLVAASTATLSVDKTNVNVNEEIRVTVTPADGKEFRAVRLFFDEIDWWDRYYDSWAFGEDGRLNEEHFSFWETGDYTLKAAVTYDDWNDDWEEDQRTWTETNGIKIHFAKVGDTGAFTFSLDKTTVPRGDSINVTYTNASNADHYYLSIFRRKADGSDGDGVGWHAHSEKAGTISFDNTYEFEPGQYNVYGEANGEGYATSYSNPEKPVVLTIEEPASKDPVLKVEKTTLDTCENSSYTVFAPDAKWIEVFFNYKDDENWRDSRGEEYMDGGLGYSRSGVYTVQAVAHYFETNSDGSPKYPDKNGDPSDEKTVLSNPVNVTVSGSKGGEVLGVSLPDAVPSYLIKGDALNFTCNKPAKAESFRVSVWYDPDQEGVDGELFSEETDKDTIQVSISKEKLEAIPDGRNVKMEINAWGPGYEEGNEYRELPIVSKPSSSVKLELSKNTVLVNEDFEISVSATSSRKITGVRIWRDEENNWMWGHIFRSWDLERDGTLLVDTSWGSVGKHAIYAQVTFDESFNDWDGDWDSMNKYEWLTSNVQTLTTTKKGRVGEFTLSVANTTARRGETISATITSSSNADEYWIDSEYLNTANNEWEFYDRVAESSASGKITIFTSRMEPGKYRLFGNACGKGYEGREATNEPIEITITEPSLKEGEVQLNVNKQSADTCEQIECSVFAPGAQWTEVYPDYENNKGWHMNEGGESANHRYWYGNPDTYQIVAIAHYYKADKDGNPIGEETTKESAPVTVTVTASTGKTLSIDSINYPAYLKKGDSLTITAKKPSGAEQISADVWYDTDQEDADTGLFNGETRKDTLTINIPAADLEGVKEGFAVRVNLDASARGHYSAHTSLEIPVITPDPSVSISLEKTQVEVNAPLELTVSTTSSKTMKWIRIRKDEESNWLWDCVFDQGDLKEDGTLVVSPDWWSPGQHVVYAQVCFDDWDVNWDRVDELNWLTTEPKTFTVTQKGVVGDFIFTTDKEVIAAGDSLTITYGTAKNANHYWVDVDKWDENSKEWHWYDHLADAEKAEDVMIKDYNWEVGNYRLYGYANGIGYVNKRASNSPIKLTVISKDAANHAASVAAQLNALPAKAGIKDESGVKAARAAYNALSDDQKKYIGTDTYGKLTAAESSVAAEKKAAEEAAKKAAEEAAKKKAEEEAAKKAAEEAAKKKAEEEAAKKAEKKANTLRVKVKNPSVKASKKKISISAKKVFTVTKAQGKVSYKKVSGAKALKISKSGKITVAKGTKKGTYKMKVTVTAAGNDSYKEGSKTVTVKVKVKN